MTVHKKLLLREDIEKEVFTALGTAVMAWSNLAGAGKFNAEGVRSVGEELITRILYIANADK